MSAADALQEWLDKTSWFKPQTHELGMHVLDAIYQRLQHYVGLAARRSIELRLVQQLLEDPHKEFTALDMEYWNTLHDQLYAALSKQPQQPQQFETTAEEAAYYRGYMAALDKPIPGWLRAVDEELVNTHLGVAKHTDSYQTAKYKLNQLICWHLEVATDPKTNGGYRLTRTKS